MMYPQSQYSRSLKHIKSPKKFELRGAKLRQMMEKGGNAKRASLVSPPLRSSNFWEMNTF